MNELNGWLRAVSWSVDHFDLSCLGRNTVLASILVTERVSTDDDRFFPTWHQTWDIFNDDRLAEDSAIKDVANGTIRGLPHLLEVEFFDSALIRGDGGTLNSDLVLEHGVGTVNSDLIIGSVTVLDREIIVFCFQVNIGVDVLFCELDIMKSLPFL